MPRAVVGAGPYKGVWYQPYKPKFAYPSFPHKQKRQVFRPVLIIALSDSALNLVGTEASGTCVHMARSPVNDSLDSLHIGLPSTVGTSVGVRNLDTKGYALTTKITLSHSLHLPSFHYSVIHALSQALRYDNKLSAKKQALFSKFFVFLKIC